MIEAGTEVYEGMVVGINSRDDDLAVNVCREKQMTNIRSSTSDISVRLTPPVAVQPGGVARLPGRRRAAGGHPEAYRIRKRILDTDTRQKSNRRS